MGRVGCVQTSLGRWPELDLLTNAGSKPLAPAWSAFPEPLGVVSAILAGAALRSPIGISTTQHGINSPYSKFNCMQTQPHTKYGAGKLYYRAMILGRASRR